ncbi:unnamed protein product, partial [Ectocarpus fasciculatus]
VTLLLRTTHSSSAKGSGNGRWEQRSEAWCLQQCRPTFYLHCVVWYGCRASCLFQPLGNFYRCLKPLFSVIWQVVLSFFPAAFSGSLTGGCECQMRTLNQELSSIAGNEEAFVGVCDLGSMLAKKSGVSAMKGHLAANRGVVVIDDGKVVYKWVGKNTETGRPDPSILPDIGRVARALASGRARL